MPEKHRPGEGDWLRAQYGMAHHDIWWVKSQMMQAGSWTLALLGGLVAIGGLLKYEGPPVKTTLGHILAGLGGAVTVLGLAYVWDLQKTLLRSRAVARRIVEPLKHSVFEGPKNPSQSRLFPVSITAILAVALGFTQYYFGTLTVCVGAAEGVVILAVAAWGWRTPKLPAPAE